MKLKRNGIFPSYLWIFNWCLVFESSRNMIKIQKILKVFTVIMFNKVWYLLCRWNSVNSAATTHTRSHHNSNCMCNIKRWETLHESKRKKKQKNLTTVTDSNFWKWRNNVTQHGRFENVWHCLLLNKPFANLVRMIIGYDFITARRWAREIWISLVVVYADKIFCIFVSCKHLFLNAKFTPFREKRQKKMCFELLHIYNRWIILAPSVDYKFLWHESWRRRFNRFSDDLPQVEAGMLGKKHAIFSL